MKPIYTLLDDQLQPLPAGAKLDQAAAVRIEGHGRDIIIGKALPKRMTQGEAEEAIAKMTLGNSAWQLTSTRDLVTPIDWTQDPAAPAEFFGDAMGPHWTRDEVPGYPGYFRVVYFDCGNVNGGLLGDYDRFFARPVRVGGLPAGQ